MNSLESLCDDILRAPLRPGQDAASRGQRIVGYLSADVPTELIIAAGSFPLRLPAIAHASTATADLYFEAGFLPAHRSIAEQWLSSTFNFIDTVIFSRGNDSEQRLYYYLCELQRTGRAAGPRPLLYDVAKIPRASSAEYTLGATQRLADQLAVHREELPGAIGQANRLRAGLARMQTLRRGSTPPCGLLWSRVERIAGLVSIAPLCEFLEKCALESDTPWRAPRLLLAGSSPPDERLYEVIAAAGARVTGEYAEHTSDLTQVEPGNDPMRALAERSHRTRGSRSFHDVPEALAREVHACHADGVVLWLIEEEESWTWEVPGIRERLGREGTPLLTLARMQWNDVETTTNPIKDFVASLRVAR